MAIGVQCVAPGGRQLPALTLTRTLTRTLTLTLTRYRKESIKGKLHDRFINNKKGKNVDARYVTLSIEGRTLDRV